MTGYAYVGRMGEMDERVEIGTQVGFQEEFCQGCETDKPCPSYIVLDMPDSGNTIVITRILHTGDDDGGYVVINPSVTIEVEPWKLGTI